MGIYPFACSLFGFRVVIPKADIPGTIDRFYRSLEERGIQHKKNWHIEDTEGVTFYAPKTAGATGKGGA